MKNIFLSALAITILFLVNQFIFIPSHLLYEIVWLDIPLHILGAGLFAVLFISILNFNNIKITWTKIIISVMIVGILWEVYEYSNHYFFGRDWNGIADTVKDLFDDFLGASLVFIFNKKNSLVAKP